MAALGLRKGDKVGFMSYPREEFNITHLACNYKSFCIVSVYETLPDKDAAKIIEHSEAKVICVLETFLPKLHSIFEIAPAIKDQLKYFLLPSLFFITLYIYSHFFNHECRIAK